MKLIPGLLRASKHVGRSREGAWIEIMSAAKRWQNGRSRSREGAWIEISKALPFLSVGSSRSREGAWIEIITFSLVISVSTVAPARERGLKSCRRWS